MQHIPSIALLLTIALVVTLLVLSVRIDRHKSALDSAFESNRIRAAVRIENLHTWMGVIGLVAAIAFVIFMASALGLYHVNRPTAC